MSPLLQRLFDAERVAELESARVVLVGAVVAMDGHQFFATENADRLEELHHGDDAKYSSGNQKKDIHLPAGHEDS